MSRLLVRLFPPLIVAALLAAACSSDTTPTAEPTSTTSTDAAPSSTTTTTAAIETTSDAPTSSDGAAAVVPADVGSESLDDPYVRTAGNGGYDVASYDIAIAWDPDTQVIDAVTTIEASATQDLGRFNLDLYKLAVSAVTIDGVEAELAQTDTELTVTPATAIAAGDSMTIEVAYSGVPQEEPGPLGSSKYAGWHIREDSVYVLGEPLAAATFHPANDHPSDKAAFTFRLTAPTELTAVAVGTLSDRQDNGDGTTTWVYEQPFPQTTYLTTLLMGPFEVREADPSQSGVPIRNVFYSEIADLVEPIFDSQDEMIDAFEPLFGAYPFDVYGSAVADDIVGGALETQTLSTFGRDVLQFGPFAEAVVAHELAHQWFGNAVSIERWEDLWLNEGFASYSEALWREASDPSFTFEQWIRETSFFGPELEARVHQPDVDNLFGFQVYQRGALTLHALRVEVGDEIFFEILRTWVERFSGESASTADFQTLAEELSGAELDEFFDVWLRTTELPPELDGVPLVPIP